MKKKASAFYLSSAVLVFLFCMLIALLKTVDVKAVGPNGSEIGLAAFNTTVRDAVGYNEVWYDITEIFGYISIVVAVCFALLGGYQLISRKSFKKVDTDIYLLAGLYFVLAVCYIAFEKIVINYRPVLSDGVLEASFPSSHTMLVVTVMMSAVFQLRRRIKNTVLRNISVCSACLVAVATVAGRLISGVHWCTDIIGGLLLGGALVLAYAWAESVFVKKE